MYLSKLEIFGFKSFAKKEIFQFDSGLTGVVGPNGCGKSNIVDAIRWVLGEQRPKILRCDRMENLIFNGTKTRKPLNLAEVSIFIENNREILPSEYTEIKISRRLYRSGESEYLLNNQQVRLLDIINLFTDTGMGADAYSMIELKMVEQILSENAEERLRLFEEAAGIKKYKIRRKSALRKLETTHHELTRVEDVIAEVQKNVNSLARQVGKARRYHQYKQELKEKDVLIFRLKLRAYEADLNPLTLELEQIQRSRDTFKNEVHTEEARLERLQAEAVQSEEMYRRIADQLFKEDEQIREIQKNQQLRKQRIESLTENIQRQQSEIEILQGKIEALQTEEKKLTEQQARVRENQEKAQSAYRKSASAQDAAEQKYEAVQQEYQHFVQSNLQEMQLAASARESYQRSQLEMENIHSRIEKNQSILSRLRTELQSKETDLASARKFLREQQEEFDQFSAEISHLQTVLENTRTEQDDLRRQQSILSGETEQFRSRKEFLTRIIENYEGFSENVQFVMSRKEEFGGVVDTLANLIETEPAYQQALEGYLSGVADYLIVNEVNTAREILNSLKSQNRGRLTLIPLPLLKSGEKTAPTPYPALNKNSTPAREVIKFEPRFEPLFEWLFGRVYIVPDLDTALKMREEHPEFTFLTRDGEVLSDWGHITGGSPETGNKLLGRQEELQSLSRQLNEKESELEKINRRVAETEDVLTTSRNKLAEFTALKKEAEQKLFEAEKRAGQISNEVNHQRKVADELQAEIAELELKLSQLKDENQKLSPQIHSGEEKTTTYQSQEKLLAEKRADAEKTLREITRETQDLQISFLSLMNEENSLKDKISYTGTALTDAREKIQQLEKSILEDKKNINLLSENNAQADKELDKAYTRRDSTGSEKENLEQELQELRASIQAKTEELKKKNRLFNQARERVQDLELRIRELEIKRDSQAEQIQDKYGLEAVTAHGPELEPTMTLSQVQEDLDQLHKKLESLGDVNPLAIKEHEQEKERLDFLKTQEADLRAAEEQLLDTINQLNKTARKQFMETFGKIRSNFQRVFSEFFQNGEGDLVLMENHDPLDAQIEFSITVKGRKLKTLSLLSTGEKTLTAISLLFSIYLVKPSPFCILDEVDAPLDDLNITQFTRAIERFSHNTQFILVTHNKRTMEAAQSLYGITMEEPGVSKVVSVRLD